MSAPAFHMQRWYRTFFKWPLVAVLYSRSLLVSVIRIPKEESEVISSLLHPFTFVHLKKIS